MELVKAANQVTDELWDPERFSFLSQVRHAAVLAPSNIAHGASSQAKKKSIQFWTFSRAPLGELDTQARLCDQAVLSESSHVCFLASHVATVKGFSSSLIRFHSSRTTQSS